MTDKTLLLLDGHSLAYRAYYALREADLRTTTGQPTQAVFGFTSMLINLLRDEKPTHVGVAFDVSRQTFRTEQYAEYKAGRAETPDDFRGQIDLIGEVLDSLGIKTLRREGYEADDILATLTAQAGSDFTVLLCTGDRDGLQLVSDNVTVLYPKRGVSDLARMTPEAVETKYGVGPDRYPELAALVGEKSDNLPGVPGVGEKTAAKWLKAYDGLDNIIARVDEIKGKVGDSLRAHLDDVIRNRSLNALVRDLDLPLSPDDLIRGELDRETVHQTFDALEFHVLRDRLLAISGGAGATTEKKQIQANASLCAGADLSTWLSDHADATVAIVSARDGESLALAAVEDDEAGTVALIDLSQADCSDDTELGRWLADGKYPKVAHDSKALKHTLAERGYQLRAVTFDTELAAYLCHPDQRNYHLTDIAERYLNAGLADADDNGGQGELALDFRDSVAPDLQRAADRAAAVAGLVVPLQGAISSRGASELFSTMELPVADVLYQMEHTGIAVDTAYLDDLDKEFASAAQRYESAAYESIDREVNLGSPKQLQEVLFDQLQMPKTKKIKTGHSTDADSLTDLLVTTQHPFLENLLSYRDVTKLRQTVEGLLRAVGDDGRIHTTYQQTIAATGRLSSTNPNLQNIPIRTDEGRRIRSAFVVGDNYECLLTADYSQIEMRIMAHLSADESLIEAFHSGEDLHSYVGSRVFDVQPDDVTAAMRAKVKAMSYGLAYGLSAFGLSRQLRISRAEAKSLMDDYFERFGGIRDYLDVVVTDARKTGFTETIWGRRRYLPDLTSDNRQRRSMAERMALNAPIQGSAADLMKVAMLDVADKLQAAHLMSRMLLQVHDELVLEVAPGEREAVEEIVESAMRSAAQLAVPLEISVGSGHSWQDAAH